MSFTYLPANKSIESMSAACIIVPATFDEEVPALEKMVSAGVLVRQVDGETEEDFSEEVTELVEEIEEVLENPDMDDEDKTEVIDDLIEELEEMKDDIEEGSESNPDEVE